MSGCRSNCTNYWCARRQWRGPARRQLEVLQQGATRAVGRTLRTGPSSIDFAGPTPCDSMRWNGLRLLVADGIHAILRYPQEV